MVLLMRVFGRIRSGLSAGKTNSAPLLIIKKNADDGDVKEFRSIEEAIADLEQDPNVSSAKIEKLRSTLKKLKNKTSITIRHGEIV
jgi:septal ring factor EnvC (AmiA/AmiB activator)